MRSSSALFASTRDPAGLDHMHAWLLLVAALAAHVLDEALTGFLEFYNPLVRSLRSQIGWFPMPTFTFRIWLAGLVAAVGLLALLAPAVRRGAPGTRILSWVFCTVMIANGLGHLGGSIYFGRWLPGATTAPLLLVAGVLLARATWRRPRPV